MEAESDDQKSLENLVQIGHEIAALGYDPDAEPEPTRGVARIELIAGNDLLIIEQIDVRDVAITIMDENGDETGVRVGIALVRRALELFDLGAGL